MKWGNATVTKKVVDGDNFTLYATIDEEDKDFKKTKKSHGFVLTLLQLLKSSLLNMPILLISLKLKRLTMLRNLSTKTLSWNQLPSLKEFYELYKKETFSNLSVAAST